jgi:hypothetical protein
MNTVRYIKELVHSFLSANSNCCAGKLDESAFGVHP